MVRKIPPPPPIATADPMFNRWLLELASILSNDGDIDPNSIDGYPALQAQVATNTTDIGTLQGDVGGNTADIGALQASVIAINGDITTINGELTSLGARGELLNGTGDPAPGLGKINDWYGDPAGAVGHRVFLKTGVATWTPFPF